jgi:hypothetical protein
MQVMCARAKVDFFCVLLGRRCKDTAALRAMYAVTAV